MKMKWPLPSRRDYPPSRLSSQACVRTDVLIALLAANRPELVPVAALLYAAAQVGAAAMQRQANVPSSMVSILIGCVVIMLLARAWFSARVSRKGKQHV